MKLFSLSSSVKRLLLSLLLIFLYFGLRSQQVNLIAAKQESKKKIDMAALGNWPYVYAPVISPDGQFVSFTIDRQPQKSRTLFVKKVNGQWNKQFVGGSNALFSDDNKSFIFLSSDTLCFQTLQSDLLVKIPGVVSVQSPQNNSGTWLAYQLKSHPNTVLIRNLITGFEKKIVDVDQYYFDISGNSLLVESCSSHCLKWMDLIEGCSQTIWQDDHAIVKKFVFDASGKQVSFIVNSLNDNKNNSIWYCKAGMKKAIQLVNNQSAAVDSGLLIESSELEFSFSGNYICFTLHSSFEKTKPIGDAVSIDVWHYKDVILQSQQLKDNGVKSNFAAVVSVSDGRIIKLENKEEKLFTSLAQSTADVAVVEVSDNELWWKEDRRHAYFLIFLNNGNRKLLKEGRVEGKTFSFSPNGNFIVYFDNIGKNYVSHELNTGVIRKLSLGVNESLTNEYEQFNPKFITSVGVAGWLENESGLIVYDNYDVWRLDPSGRRRAVNITHGYGRKEHIKFRLVYPPSVINKVSDTSTVLLTAFHTQNKYNGFYSCYVNKSAQPEKLFMGPYHLYRMLTQVPNGADAFDGSMIPLKAKNANIWVVMRQSSTEAPNYFITSDFKIFEPFTDLQPQKEYNWLTTDLISWKQLDGTVSQGILYKPEDFDPHKRYPLILTYYEKFSFRMHEYPKPTFTTDRLNIPWFVSHGYLVFTPDIHYSIASSSGKVAGDAAVNSLVSIACHLAKFPYVDSNRIGLQGHSFAGYQTSYVITRSNKFAAACEAAGTNDLISAYLGLIRTREKPGADKQSIYEIGRGRVGATLWQRPDLYIKYSPVFKADKVQTPLLIMHNEGDFAVDWNQAVEMYMALRRQEKRVWMLQYDGEGHSVNGKNAIDFSIRLMQFFDHYLKAALPPKWMTEGIPAAMKGIDTGYQPDSYGICGKDCNICKKTTGHGSKTK